MALLVSQLLYYFVFDKSKAFDILTFVGLTSVRDIASCHRVLISEIVCTDADVGAILELMAAWWKGRRREITERLER